MRQKLRRIVDRVATVMLVAVLLAVPTVWLTFQHRPAWYRPPKLGEADLRRARNEALTTADTVSDRIVEGRAFDLVLTDRAVNEWLSAFPSDWGSRRWRLPAGVTEPAVRFEPGIVLIGAHASLNGWRAILNVSLSLAVSTDGQSLRVALKRARGGSLPIPRALLRTLLAPLSEPATPRSHAERAASDPPATMFEGIGSVDELFEGVNTRNRFIWSNGRRPFRFEAITITDGKLHLRIVPL